MIAEATGRDAESRPVRARWSLWAEANAGPNVPPAPAAALITALANGSETRRGAYTAAGLLDLDAALAPLAAVPIKPRQDEGWPLSQVLFRRLLGNGLDHLPSSVRAVHDSTNDVILTGRAQARAGRSVVARLLRFVLGIPPSGRSDVEVRIAPDARGETWRRQFGAARFSSRLTGADDLGTFRERVGPVRFTLFVHYQDSGGSCIVSMSLA